MDYELLRNGSGYKDYTAYQAMTNCLKGYKNMRQGEILETEKQDAIGYVVIIADHGNFNTGLYLYDEPGFGDGSIEIKTNKIMYADPRMVSFVHSDRLKKLVRKLNEDKLQEIRLKVGKALGFSNIVQENSEKNNLEIELITAEKEVYKELYEKLLEAVLSNAGR